MRYLATFQDGCNAPTELIPAVFWLFPVRYFESSLEIPPGAPPGRAGLNVHVPSAPACTSGDAGVSPPGAGWGACEPGDCGCGLGLRSSPAVRWGEGEGGVMAAG